MFSDEYAGHDMSLDLGSTKKAITGERTSKSEALYDHPGTVKEPSAAMGTIADCAVARSARALYSPWPLSHHMLQLP